MMRTRHKGYVVLLVLLSACATPPKKPLSKDSRAKIQNADIYVKADEQGIGVQYFIPRGAAPSLGLAGALIAIIIEEGLNPTRTPMDAVKASAEQLAVGFDLKVVNQEIQSRVGAHLREHPLFEKNTEATILEDQQKVESIKAAEHHMLTIEFEYFLEQDLRSLTVVGTAKLFDAQAANDKPTADLRTSERLYQNRFEFHSNRLDPAPEKSKEEIAAQVSAIRSKYPRAGSDNRQFLLRRAELAEARRQLSPWLKADYFVKQWLLNDSARLRSELAIGIEGVIALLASDLMDPTMPSFETNKPEIISVDKQAGRRTIRFTNGPFAGALSSQPIDYVKPESTGIAYSIKLGRKHELPSGMGPHGAPQNREGSRSDTRPETPRMHQQIQID